ncbi:ankyrin repeat and protein kinase domain-containing protein 1 [Genypterus blacodes]|uniref:ankyrin repeat and protein kinase domain-containing protein 1 n=1 Tax=Genypterus blacodes TaxID=154954 RepID=UPI003F775FA7
MERLGRACGELRDFRKVDFEADWIKVAECRFGEVYQVQLRGQQESLALKTFNTSLCAEGFYRRVINEVSKVATLKSPHIVPIYGLCSDVTAIVMKHMSNGSLNSLLGTHTLMWPKKFQMIHEASAGMNFLHSMKPPLLHLNLKTSNILLDNTLHAKISDFGLIQWEDGMNKNVFMEHLIARGNLSYIPPETFTQGLDPPGTAFDVYSFAIVMWEILTQQKPHTGSSVTTVLLQVSNGKRPSVEMIPDRKPRECEVMTGLMRQCWDHDSRKRPQFSDVVRRTEAMSDVLRIPGSNQRQRPDAGGPQSPIHTIASPVMCGFPSEAQYGRNGILSLLSRGDFVSFRVSVRREDTSVRFAGEKRLLHYTVASGDTHSVQHVLSLGADVNCTTARGYTPLIIAVLHRLYDIISLLLDHGAATNLCDEDQWTALHFAAQSGDDRTVRLLLDKGAVVEAREKAGWMPLHLACQNNHEPVVRLLLSRLSDKALEECRTAQGRMPLHLACAYGHLSIAKLLLFQGADANATDQSLLTALHLSADDGHNRVVRHLVKSGAHIDAVDIRGYTPLHLAALRGHTGICRQLLSNGASPDPKTLQGWTPVHLAALKGQQATVFQLLCQGCSVNAKGENGWTPLHLACHQSDPDAVAKLLEAEADPDTREDSGGWTPLHVACTTVCLRSVLHLISHHADVNAVNWAKVTPLHMAAQRGCAVIVEALLLNGADRTLLDSSGCTALNMAQKGDKAEVLQLLQK